MDYSFMMAELQEGQEEDIVDKYTSIRAKISTVKRLDQFKIHPNESLESVIKKAIGVVEKERTRRLAKQLEQSREKSDEH